MLWQKLQKKLKSTDIEGAAPTKSRPVIFIDSQQQLLSCVSAQDKVIQYYPISTSKFGLGQCQGSFKTPAGIHKIAQKIGSKQPVGRVFKSRIATQEICLSEDFSGEEDVITSRILWLQGLQAGYNCDGDVDTFKRYIYIHGTADESHIGQPASIGCIRMRNLDVIKLFEYVEVGDVVIIE